MVLTPPMLTEAPGGTVMMMVPSSVVCAWATDRPRNATASAAAPQPSVLSTAISFLQVASRRCVAAIIGACGPSVHENATRVSLAEVKNLAWPQDAVVLVP